MEVYLICATYNRHTLLERSVKMFIDQDYVGPHTLLIYNNSPHKEELNVIELPENKKIILINNHIDKSTGKQYENLGGIYNDILEYIPNNVLVSFWDNDDGFYPFHVTEGVKGWLKGKKKAYKPANSYFYTNNTVSSVNNTLEPSIFCIVEHIKKHKFRLSTSDQHLQWVEPLIKENELFVDPEGVSSLIYDWNSPVPTYKTSGNPYKEENFSNCRKFSEDVGDQLITPWTDEQIKQYFTNIENVKKS